ncbi:hypothetical protein RMSM_01692 [Rhodopirellula maiorica SM1]|uniref:Uncharacterized protein n=1 Tax=Rhodopirellula maiorica SM1 TaxID=1265738 RepID=M5RQ15_9BACT|nr:hypothetical protein RMSM_01692 [Rhodopirellula maiorica SM1]
MLLPVFSNESFCAALSRLHGGFRLHRTLENRGIRRVTSNFFGHREPPRSIATTRAGSLCFGCMPAAQRRFGAAWHVNRYLDRAAWQSRHHHVRRVEFTSDIPGVFYIEARPAISNV